MNLSRPVIRAIALFGTVLCTPLGAQETAPPAPEPPDSVGDEIVVSGRAIEQLKLKIERAEDDVYARFNAINSDDSYDIHCYERARCG